MMWWDQGFYVFVIPAMIFAMWAQAKVRSAYNTYSRLRSQSGRTAVEVAAALLRNSGLGDVRIEKQRGQLTDHYDPRSRTLRLSDSTYDSPSVAAIAIAAHEVGHAVQHSVGYAPLALRNGLVPVAQFTSQAAFPLFFIGLFMNSGFLMDLGLLFFLGAVLFQAITLPVEFNASKRALDMLQVSGYVAPSEVVPVGNMLNAAALTYVAGMAVAVAQLLRLLVLRGGRRRD
ncbi:MAG: zinc metallopeptidase [Bacillota bacterium]|jgi:Zn-dependent membrane protease YugP|nr:zinc metallopeptidase [Candidatus Fermentithermobacillaceae bacterium]